MRRSLTLAAALAAAPLGHPSSLRAQQPVDAAPPADSLLAESDTFGFALGVSQRRARLVVASGKTYNRVEGLPTYIGPTFVRGAGGLRFSAEAFGVLRSAETFKLDSRNLGHLLSAELRTLGYSGAALRVASYDLVSAVEEWQMPRGEAGIAAFFLHRDYRDHFGRKGASISASIFSGSVATLELGFASEWWSSLETRQVLTVLRNNHRWRPNPAVDDGRARLFTVRSQLDTRNDTRLPSTGWLLKAEYEMGRADFVSLGPTSSIARPSTDGLHPRYGRGLLDARRYNRIGPESQLNLRLVTGGWLHGDELPLQRRLSVGGPATIPGIHFRDTRFTPDVYTCSEPDLPPGSPAQCERLLLFQAEYREELPFRPGTILGGTPLRIRSASLTLRPVLVAFLDIGRGWLLPQAQTSVIPLASAASGQRISAPAVIGADVVLESPQSKSNWSVPPLSTFSTDVGLGVDLGLLGAYLAVSLSESGSPAHLILRARTRF